MSGTVRFKFPTARKRGREHRTRRRDVRATGLSRAARMLALAHHVKRLVEAGELTDYAEAARNLGLTRGRLTQVMNLLLLAPETQERVLVGDVRATERSLRRTVAEPVWDRQLSRLTVAPRRKPA